MILSGVCSWTEKSLVKSGDFYPRAANSAEDRLRHYASFFQTVEVDSAYYAIPDRRNAAAWAERTPPGFIFHIKAYGPLTGHGIDPKTLPADICALLPREERQKRLVYIRRAGLLRLISGRLAENLEPLLTSGKLGLIVFQYPPWFVCRKSHFDYILFCREIMNGLPIAVEFRHGSWLLPEKEEEVFRFLESHGITSVTADEPQYGTLATIPFIPRVTTDTAYFRFHGRNKENWLRRGIETSLRYDYLYSEDELVSFLPPLRGAERKAGVVYAMFNNCHGSSAVKNALRMKELTRQEKRDAGQVVSKGT